MNPLLGYTPFFDAILENFGGWSWGMLLVLGIDIMFASTLVLTLIIIMFLPTFRFRQAAFAVFKRNFVGYFNSPTGYVFLCLFVLLTSLAAFWPHEFFASNLANLDQLNRWLPYIMLTFIPAITMSIWADEKRQGTDELLLTLPATDYEIVLGKYFACVGIFTVSLVFSQIWNYCVLAALTAGMMDVGLIMTTYLGYWFIGLAMLSIGMVASFLTRNLTIAFIFGVAFNAPLAFLADLDLLLPNSRSLNLIQQWSLLDRFDSFGRGVISIAPIFYYLGIIALGIYISLVLIGRRHWSGARAGLIKLTHYLARLGCLVAITIGLTLIGQYTFLNQLRSDQSEGRVSSLSPETREILKKLSATANEDGSDQSPIVIDAYLSDEVPPEYVRTRYDLVSLLREFDALGGERISLNLFTGVEPFSENAVAAEKSFKISPVEVTSQNRGMVRNERLVLGASFRSGLERVTVPFFHYGTPVEYELIRSINTVANKRRKTLGVLRTSANLMGGTVFNGVQYERVAKQQIMFELEKQYNVEQVDATAPIEVWLKDEATGEERLRYDVLIAAQPSSLGPLELKNFIDAVRAGQPVAIFEDPVPRLLPVLATSMRPQGQNKGDIRQLWELLGIQPSQTPGSNGRDQLSIIWQDSNPYPQLEELTKTPEYVFVRELPGALKDDQSLAYDSPITSELEEVLFPHPGAIVNSSDKLDFKPLVRTGNAGAIPFEDWLPIRDDIRKLEAVRGKPSGRFTLAAEITGKVQQTAAPSANATAPQDGELSAKPLEQDLPIERDLKVIYVADLDFLESGIVSMWKQPGFRERGTVFRMQNTIFVLNIIDYLAEDETYIPIRTRQRSHRTLQQIEKLVEDAQDNVIKSKQDKEKEFEDTLKQTEQDLRKDLVPLQNAIKSMQEDKSTDPKLVALRENQLRLKAETAGKKLLAEQERLEREKDAEIREIEREMELKIQRTQTDFKVWSAILPPILPLLIGFIVYAKRRLREREGVAKSRLR